MKNNRPSSVTASLLAALTVSASHSWADDLAFNAPNTRLNGSVTAIQDDGSVTLLTPHAPEPLQLTPGTVRKISFSQDNSQQPSPTPTDPQSPLSRVRLANGDVLPVLIESLDDTKLVVQSPDAGRLEIPRIQLRAILPGAANAPVLYSGPTSDGWRNAPQTSNEWEFQDKEFSASGTAEASRSIVNLPQAFTMRFKLSWETQPNFQLHFADPLLPKGQPADRYLFRMTPSGIDLKRESTSGRRYRDVAVLNRRPSSFPNSSVKIEIRVDRPNGKLEILLNGESEGTFPDPSAPPPTGNGFTLVSNTPSGETLTVSRIEVLGTGSSGTTSNPLPDQPTKDVITTSEDEQWRGILQSIRPSNHGLIIDFQPEPPANRVEIPLSQVAWTALATPETTEKNSDPLPPVITPSIRIRLHGGTELSASSCRFNGQTLTTSHPLLGSLELPKHRLSAIEFQTTRKP